MVINNTLIDVLQVEKWVAVPWKKLQVGDIIRVSVLTSVVISL
jgi:phospholipid-transporting ATPase